MSTERKQVLDLLAEGKITSEEAMRLLDRIGESGQTGANAAPESSASGLPKFMCVRVDTHEGDEVNVRIPLALLRTGIKLSAMMPKNAAEAMAKNGVDLSQLSALSGDELLNALRAMQVDVASHEGDLVKVYCE
jgi:hypothetical protein